MNSARAPKVTRYKGWTIHPPDPNDYIPQFAVYDEAGERRATANTLPRAKATVQWYLTKRDTAGEGSPK